MSDRISAILARIESESLRPSFSPDLLSTVPVRGTVASRSDYYGRKKAKPVRYTSYRRSDGTLGNRPLPEPTEPNRDYRGGYVATGTR